MSKDTCSNILMPLLSYRFRVMFPSKGIITDKNIELTQQIKKCSFDFLNKEFKVEIRQPIVPGVIGSVCDIVKNTPNIYVEALTSDNKNIHFSIILQGCECKSHDFTLDYGANGPDAVATHKLIFKYYQLTEEIGVSWETPKEEPQDPSFGLTPQEVVEKVK